MSEPMTPEMSAEDKKSAITIAANALWAFAEQEVNHPFGGCDLNRVGSPGRNYRSCTCGLDKVVENLRKAGESL